MQWRGRSRGGQLSCQKFDEITALVDPPLTERKLIELAEWYFQPHLFSLLAYLLREQPYITNELEKRLEGHQISQDLVIAPLTTGDEPSFKRVAGLLEIDTTLLSLSQPDSDDLKQTALLRVLEKIEEANVINCVALRPYPFPLRPDIQWIWQENVAQVWRRECELVLGKLKAGLEVTDEVLRQNVRPQTEHESEKRGARRRRAIVRKRQAETDCEILHQGQKIERLVANNKAKSDLVQLARARWGERAAKAVAYIVIH